MKVRQITDVSQKPVDMEGANEVKMRMLIGPAENAKVFHMRHFEIAPGGNTPHHAHNYEHEVIILKGTGLAASEEGDRPLKSGDVVWVPPNEKHQFTNVGEDLLRFICVIPLPQRS